MNKIHLTDDAKEDIRESAKYYESKQTELGLDFLEKIEEALQRIKRNPEQFPQSIKKLEGHYQKNFHTKFYLLLKAWNYCICSISF